VVFIADDDITIIEFGRLHEIDSINFEKIGYIQIHFTIKCDDPIKLANQLVDKGARLLRESPRYSYKNEKVVIRDPRGTYIQLVNRANQVA
jgi:hypothetical protein